MVRIVARAWVWLVDGLNEAVGWVLDRKLSRSALRVEVGPASACIRAPSGGAVAQLVETEGVWRFAPPDAGRRLAGVPVEVLVPPDWLFRRKLEPVAAQGAPFLSAFVHHQIDRVTPWRPEDVHVGILHAPLPGDASRLAVEIGVLPKRLTEGLLAALQGCEPGRLALVARPLPEGPRFVIPIGQQAALRLARRRQPVAYAVAALLLAWPVAVGALWWDTMTIGEEIDAADEVIAQRKAVLAAAARHDHAGTDGEAALQRLRDSRPRAVDMIEALSAAMPDDAYVTDLSLDKDEVRVSGVSSNTTRIVPALEASGRFADAAFFDATTRIENGRGDRFHIEMRARAAPPVPPPGPIQPGALSMAAP